MSRPARPWFVYLLRCSDDSLYCGATNRPRHRIKAHNAGAGSKYTRSRLPVFLSWKRRCESKGEALAWEANIKRLTRKQKEQLLRNAANGEADQRS